ETLRGDIDGDTIVVRQPAEGEEPLARGDDVIVLLDGRTADGVYPLHHPAGRYRIDGDEVVVNASGVDGASLSAKDLRPRAPDEHVSLERFRMLVGARVDNAPTLAAPSPPTTHHAPADVRPPKPAQDSSPTRWPWIVVAAAAAALLLYGALRAR